MRSLKKICSLIIMIATVAMLGWMLISFIEIMLHQGDTFFKGTEYTYTNRNFFIFIYNIFA